MHRVLEALPRAPQTVLDVGCAHGRFAALLAEHGVEAAYTGVDASRALLARARARTDLVPRTSWLELDLLEAPDRLPAGPFDLVTLFGVIHHIPGETRRAALLRTLAERVAPAGTLAVAFWRTIGDAPRRRVDWDRVGIDPADLEPGDRLQTFDGDESALRYAHFADDAELGRVERAAGLPLAFRFESDGTGQVANAYLLFRREPA